MNSEMKSFRSRRAAKEMPKIKTLDLRLAITEGDLGSEVKRAFDLAKSAGQELNLFFSRAAN